MGEVTSQNEDVKFYKILLKDQISIVRNEKVWDEYVTTPVGGLEWHFVKIESGSYKGREGEDVELVKITLKDADGEYMLSSAWTSVARSIVNSLAWEEKLGKIKISVYGSVKNGKTRPSVSVKNNGNQTKWMYSIDEQKAYIEEITDKKGVVIKRDYDELNRILKNEFEQINKKFDWDSYFNEMID